MKSLGVTGERITTTLESKNLKLKKGSFEIRYLSPLTKVDVGKMVIARSGTWVCSNLCFFVCAGDVH